MTIGAILLSNCEPVSVSDTFSLTVYVYDKDGHCPVKGADVYTDPYSLQKQTDDYGKVVFDNVIPINPRIRIHAKCNGYGHNSKEINVEAGGEYVVDISIEKEQ